MGCPPIVESPSQMVTLHLSSVSFRHSSDFQTIKTCVRNDLIQNTRHAQEKSRQGANGLRVGTQVAFKTLARLGIGASFSEGS